MERRSRMPAAALALLLGLCGCINLGPLLSGRIEKVVVKHSPRWFERNRIALIDVEGFLGDEAGWLMPGTSVADVREKLERAAADPGVRALVVRVDSPGGGAAASDMIYRQIRRFREETGRPVVAALMTTAASGGYYAALAADRIVAAPTTVTGSVGAVMHLVNLEGLLGKIGVRSENIKSGQSKDIGSPTRAMTPEERAMLEGIVRGYSDRFLETMRARRPQMSDSAVATIADGRIVMAAQALELGMIDSIGYLDEAIAQARELAGIGTADVILYRPFPHYNKNIYARASAARPLTTQGLTRLLRTQGSAPLYLWAPGL